MSKIVTITLNTSIDNIIEVENFKKGEILRAKRDSLFPSGKGINVALTVATLNKEVVALGFVGTYSLRFYKPLISSKFHVNLTEVQGETRRNVTISDVKQGMITHINNPGFHINKKDIAKLEAALQGTVLPDDLVIISGSLPQGAEPSTYERLVNICQHHGALVILDTSDEPLRYGLNAKPYMIKPNLEELEILSGRKLRVSESAIIDTAHEIASSGVQLVVVSRGSEGVIAVKKDNKKVIKAYVKPEESYLPINIHGSGDALVGGIAVGLIEKRTLSDTIRLGIACGTANLFSLGPGICRLRDIKRFLPQVQIEYLKYNQFNRR
ncbi:MAG: 1-phosphofructokinase family hexose kinase [Proteobacteria bacterium]|nr:1-phosphofructokinase family hexose kinase [Pseudomonadota bacterium]